MDTSLYSAFVGTRLVATGTLNEVREATRAWADNRTGALLIFAHENGEQTDLDWRPASADPAPAVAKTGPGRPKLGVIAAEITLLPRHWDWLAAQPARASGTLRRLVEQAMESQRSDPSQRLQVLAKILWALAGNEAGFEEASRCLYAGDREGLVLAAKGWSGDLGRFVETWR